MCRFLLFIGVQIQTVDIADDNNDLAKLAENVELRQELNGSRGHQDEDEDENQNVSQEGDDTSGDEPEHPGEVSMGQKLWNFFTT